MMKAMFGGYEELRIELQSSEDGWYDARMQYQSEEQGGRFRVPVRPEQIERTIQAIWNESYQRPVRAAVMEGLDPVAEMGSTLYTALFNGPLEGFFRRSQERARASGYGLRLLLSILDESAAALPWEFLYDGRDFLALSNMSPIIRSVALNRGRNSFPSPQPGLNVLAAVSDVDFSRGRWKEMTHALYDGLTKQFDQLKVTFIDDATLSRLGEALSAGRYDVLHLCGHADVVLGVPAMILLDEKGQEVPAAPERLAELLTPAATKRPTLLCLDACNSDMLAQDLARRTHTPAVYGIRSAISNEAADSFIRGFLTALLSGQTLTAAVTQGRQAIDQERPGSREWGLPVLYTGYPDSQLTLSSWQASYSAGSSERSKDIHSVTQEAVGSPGAGKPSREHQKLETWITLKRKNLKAIEDQVAGSSYLPATVQAQMAGLREEIAALEAQLAQTP